MDCGPRFRPLLGTIVLFALALASSLHAAPGPVTEVGWSAAGGQAGAAYGSAIAVGDVNGDRFTDLLVGAPLYDRGQVDEGAAFLYLGTAAGPGPLAWVAEGDEDGAELARAIALGDVNGDGFDDIIAGAWRAGSGATAAESGRVYVWFGGASGPGADGTPANADWSAEIGEPGARFGNAVGAGDLNGDGSDDVIAAAFLADGGRGRVYVWLGGSAGLGDPGDASNFDWSATGGSGAELGAAVAAADVDNDGSDDLLIGAPGFVPVGGGPAGQAYVYLGGRAGPGINPAWTGSGGADFGRALGRAGDVNGDGIEDVVVGAPLFTNGEREEGIAYVYAGSTGGLSTAPIWSFEGGVAGAHLGAAAAGAGDVNGDGLNDVIVGAPDYAFPVDGSVGRVDLFFGALGGLSATPGWSDKGPSAGAKFASALGAFANPDADPFFDVVIGAPGGGNGQPGIWLLNGGGIGDPPVLDSLAIADEQVSGGQVTSATVVLSKNAPLGGTTVDLASSDEATATVPADVVVEEGTSAAVFLVDTLPVGQPTAVTITASLNGGSVDDALTVNPGPPPGGPPESLLIGAFTLKVIEYTAWDWNGVEGVFVDADGEAELLIDCDGADTTVAMPFAGLTIDPVAPNVGDVTVGSVSYPGTPPPPIEIEIAGFTLLIDAFTLEPTSAEADARLRLPDGIVAVPDDLDPECRRAEIDLGTVPFNPECKIFEILAGQPFGPWVIGSTGMVIEGTGVVVDLSTTEKAPNPPYPFTLPLFRGLFLIDGQTVHEPGEVVSNTGYLRAEYAFENARVTANGLSAQFSLIMDFAYTTLQPHGFVLNFPEATLNMTNSQIVSGVLQNGTIRMPIEAVQDQGGLSVNSTFETLTVQSDLDVRGEIAVADEIHWGELFNPASNELRAYSIVPDPLDIGFYTSGSILPEYYPLLANGDFQRPDIGKGADIDDLLDELETFGIQGVTLVYDSVVAVPFRIYTPDTPGGDTQPLPEPIEASHVIDPWITVGSAGVHGEIRVLLLAADPAIHELGPTYRPDYDGGNIQGTNDPAPFITVFDLLGETPDPDNLQRLRFQFVDSAVYHSDGNGRVVLPAPVGDVMRFTKMNFTSTAHIAAARVLLDVLEPIELDYWELQLLQKAGHPEAGVLHPKSGKIYLAHAGLGEPRHFALPFCLTWATIRANGEFGDLHFDYNTSGQKFDGFPFTPELLFLSEYDPADVAKLNAFLQAAGTIHIAFFGANYLDIRDHVHQLPDDINDGRHIELGLDGLNGAEPSDLDIHGDWSGGFGLMDYTIEYDVGDYDGFLGEGTMALVYVGGDLDSSAVISSERTCLSVHDDESNGHEDVHLPALASFTALGRTTGCGCIVDGVLERVHLQSELEGAANISVLVRAAEYMSIDLDLTPSTTALELQGQMFLNLAAGHQDLEATGSAGFLVDLDEDFVEGHVDGRFNASSFLNVSGGLSADGQLSWHLGALGGGYQSLQGKLAVSVIAPLGAFNKGVEGGFYVGVLAPSSEAWILQDADPKFVDFQLPETLTGVYGYAKLSKSVNLWILSGGYELYGGMGFFVDAFPEVIAQMRAHIWGDLLGGVISASAWGQLLLQLPDPVFAGSIGLEACVLFICSDIGLQLTLDKDGFHLKKN